MLLRVRFFFFKEDFVFCAHASVYMYMSVCTMDYVWRSEESLWDLVFSFYLGIPQIELWSSGLGASTFTL